MRNLLSVFASIACTIQRERCLGMSQQTVNLSDDVIIAVNGDKVPCSVGPLLRQTGWRGGTFVQYVPPTTLVDEYLIEASDGTGACGFLAFASEAYGPGEEWGAVNNFTGQQLRLDQGAVAGASTVTVTSGGGRYLFRVFETVAISPGGVRDGTAGLLTYTLNEPLKVSERGYLCNDPDGRLALVGIADPVVVGICSGVPHARNGFRVAVDLKF
jgi:hypothetical protein